MVRVTISEDAEHDLFGIYNKRLELRGPDGEDGAEALLDSLLAAMERIVRFPESGPNVPELRDMAEPGWRQISLRPYRIIYLLSDDVATVVMVADSRRDLSNLLQRRLFGRA
ncbi:MAG: type II toxin-antitoxin system RelE/ParE family toxin [Novosphingobium sp.]|uniref:type II toxin-antitoxin system RelE/ParE family toxin n=1 Tax=Novosphingobium sp. TaxID=1874826 RepID=UPI002735B9D8|nr:type II toxin-antitoxin system RelE/ParE family toxin [Novosphingobium sp.]MDP3549033.1 type II toxin-antitoxin system RelE/ParE family toxin [Novosphingobium sp.]